MSLSFSSSKRRSSEVPTTTSNDGNQPLALLSVLQPPTKRVRLNSKEEDCKHNGAIVEEAIQLVEIRKRMKKMQRQTSTLYNCPFSNLKPTARLPVPFTSKEGQSGESVLNGGLAQYSTADLIQALLQKQQQAIRDLLPAATTAMRSRAA